MPAIRAESVLTAEPRPRGDICCAVTQALPPSEQHLQHSPAADPQPAVCTASEVSRLTAARMRISRPWRSYAISSSRGSLRCDATPLQMPGSQQQPSPQVPVHDQTRALRPCVAFVLLWLLEKDGSPPTAPAAHGNVHAQHV